MEKLTIKQKEYLYRMFNKEKIFCRYNIYFIKLKPLNKLERKPLDFLLNNNLILIKNNMLLPNFNKLLVKKEYNYFIQRKFSDYSYKLISPYVLSKILFNDSEYRSDFSYTSLKELTFWGREDDKYLAVFRKKEVVGIIKYGYYLSEYYFKYKDKFIYEIAYIDIRKDYRNKGLSEYLFVCMNKEIPNLNILSSTSFSEEGEQARLENKILNIFYNKYVPRKQIQEMIREKKVTPIDIKTLVPLN